jgi:hypothetical protein
MSEIEESANALHHRVTFYRQTIMREIYLFLMMKFEKLQNLIGKLSGGFKNKNKQIQKNIQNKKLKKCRKLIKSSQKPLLALEV